MLASEALALRSWKLELMGWRDEFVLHHAHLVWVMGEFRDELLKSDFNEVDAFALESFMAETEEVVKVAGGLFSRGRRLLGAGAGLGFVEMSRSLLADLERMEGLIAVLSGIVAEYDRWRSAER